MSPVPTSIGAGLLEGTATLTARADATTTAAVNRSEQFAWPPGGKSLPFWLAIFIICPVIMVMVGWSVWECKYGSEGNDDEWRIGAFETFGVLLLNDDTWPFHDLVRRLCLVEGNANLDVSSTCAVRTHSQPTYQSTFVNWKVEMKFINIVTLLVAAVTAAPRRTKGALFDASEEGSSGQYDLVKVEKGIGP
ncbi:hypothetical protein SCARD494_14201 [Seiridium cardinale]